MCSLLRTAVSEGMAVLTPAGVFTVPASAMTFSGSALGAHPVQLPLGRVGGKHAVYVVAALCSHVLLSGCSSANTAMLKMSFMF